ncbi:hypothetical protein EFA69_19180 [Rufibacter immobilis]|uniref:Histidine kinase N-terminal 7TM region domain-containing protein n=1 Tax=Rufibacter immobilis TaxID=1348778 RepID=A0A3M9MRM2_9BACT|nr:hypothetical protein [Rufibacter immobilis]RNI28194.1 hypothetical protein EFA69_19180 [Rufibacter immobilis]
MWFIYIYFAFLALSVVSWGIRFKHLETPQKILGFSLAITLTVEIYAAHLMMQSTNNSFLYHFLIPLQCLLLSSVFYTALSGKKVRKIILFSLPVFVLAVLAIMLTLQTIREYNSFARLMKNVLVACWVLFYYREVFISVKVSRLEREPMFWISTGLLFYSLGNVFVDGLMNYLIHQSKSWALPIYYINTFLGILLNLTFFISFLVKKEAPLASPPLKPYSRPL